MTGEVSVALQPSAAAAAKARRRVVADAEEAARLLAPDAALLRRLTLAWEYNGFPADDDGALEIFDRASTAARSCAPNCALEVVRGLRRDDGSVADTLVKGDRVRQAPVGLRLRALRPIAAGDEITFCYLPDLDLRAVSDSVCGTFPIFELRRSCDAAPPRRPRRGRVPLASRVGAAAVSRAVVRRRSSASDATIRRARLEVRVPLREVRRRGAGVPRARRVLERRR